MERGEPPRTRGGEAARGTSLGKIRAAGISGMGEWMAMLLAAAAGMGEAACSTGSVYESPRANGGLLENPAAGELAAKGLGESGGDSNGLR